MAVASLGAALALLLAPPAPGPLVINTAFSPPVSAPDQSGVFDRVVHEAFRRVGREVHVQQLSAQRGLVNANAGIDDGDGPRVGGLTELGTFPGLVQVPESILNVEFVPFTRSQKVVVGGWDDLASYDVGYIRGWKILERSVKRARSVTRVRTVALLMGLLARDRADVVIVGRLIGEAAARRAGLVDVHPAGPPLLTREMYLYLNRRHETLVAPLADALRAMKADGTFDRLNEPSPSAP